MLVHVFLPSSVRNERCNRRAHLQLSFQCCTDVSILCTLSRSRVIIFCLCACYLLTAISIISPRVANLQLVLSEGDLHATKYSRGRPISCSTFRRFPALSGLGRDFPINDEHRWHVTWNYCAECIFGRRLITRYYVLLIFEKVLGRLIYFS